ncbi:MAG: ABC transporter substrate-binding protein [Chloroflexota bacterium]
MKYWTSRPIVLALVSILVIVMLILGACAKAPAPAPAPKPAPAPTPAPTPARTGTVEVRATDAPPTGVSKIVVTTSNIQVHNAAAPEDSWITVVDKEITFDLVAIQGAEVLLGTQNIAAGTYTQIRLDVSKVVVTLEGKDVTAKLPGEKLKVVRNWEVKPDEKTILTLDFDADKFVVVTGKDNVQVKPVLKLDVTQGDRPLKGKPAGPPAPAAPQVLRANLASEPATIDPNRASWSQERTVIMQVFEGLLGFNQDLTLKPVVAKEIPSTANGGISADGKTYTFKLRDNVTWSDGKKVIAKDFEYSIKRMLNPDFAAEYASFYFDIVGSEAYNGAAGKDEATKTSLKNALGVKAVDDATLQITLAQPRPTFPQLMALWPVYPVREDIIAKFGDKWTEPPNYIGNGPFLLTEWVHQDHMTFKANPAYWGAKPKLTEIQLKMISDVNAELAAYKNNELDLSRVPPGTEKATMADTTLSKEILRYNELTTFAFQFNVTSPPFDNKKLRQSLAMAVDRVAFVDKVRSGVGKPAYSWVPPGMPGHDPNLGKEYDFNPVKAKQLLTEAGYPDVSKLPELKFQYADTAGNRLIAQFMQGQMKENLGINLTLEPMESKAFTQMVNQEKHTWAWFGWGADYPDPDNWLPELFGTNAGNNHTAYSNPQFDALSKQAKQEQDNTKRLQMWADAQKMVMADAPIVTMFYRERFWLMKPYVKGMKTTGMDGVVPGDNFFGDVAIQK